MKPSRWAKTKAKIEETKTQIEALEQQQQDLRQQVAIALVDDQTTDKLEQQLMTIQQTIDAMEARIELLEQSAMKARPAHIQQELKAMEQKQMLLEETTTKARQALEPIEARYREAKARYETAHACAWAHWSANVQRRAELEHELQELAEEVGA